MNAIRMFAISFVVILGLSLSTVAIAAPIHSEQSPVAQVAAPKAEPTKTKTPEKEDEKAGTERIAQAIAKYFKVDVAKVNALFDSGKGFGEIVKAYALAQSSGKSVDEIFAMRENDQGWGKIVKTLAVTKTKENLGKIMRNSAADKNSSPSDDAPGKSGEHRNDKNKDKGK